MQSRSDRRVLGVLPLIAAIVVVTIGALFVGNNSMWSMLRADTEAGARAWGEFIVARVPQIDRIVAGEEPMEIAAAYLWGRNEFGSLRRFRIYDKSGYERIDSGQSDFRPSSEGGQLRRNLKVMDVYSSGVSRFDFTEDVVDDRTVYIARTAVPLVKEGEKIGVLEVISDETLSWNSLRAQFMWTGMEIVGLVLVAFMVPGLLYLRRNGQLAFAADRLKHTVEYDSLTGTLNRATFAAVLREQINVAGTSGQRVAVHFIDLDRFKNINDALGHAVGDQLLAATAQRLRRVIGTRERLARLGADEFAIMQPYYEGAERAIHQLGKDITREAAKPFFIEGSEIQIGATVGYAVSPHDGETVDDLVRAADIALAHAKEKSRGEAVAFDYCMETERHYRQHIEARLRHALAHNKFEIYYQPLYGVDGSVLRVSRRCCA